MEALEVPVGVARMLREGLWSIIDQRMTSPTEYNIVAEYNPSTNILDIYLYDSNGRRIAEYWGAHHD